MFEGQISFEPEFWVSLAEMYVRENDGKGIEFSQFVKLVVEYHRLLEEYSDNNIKMFKRMKDNGEMSDELFKVLSNKEITVEEFESAGKSIHDEYEEFVKKSYRGELNREELYSTYKKAIVLRNKLHKAITDIIPTILTEYELPMLYQLSVIAIVKEMEKQLDIMALQAMS